MTKPSQDSKASRRDFLKIASTTVPAALAATAMTSQAADAQPVDLDSERMQDTAHTRAYFDSARF